MSRKIIKRGEKSSNIRIGERMSESGLQIGSIVGIIFSIMTVITPLIIWCIKRIKRRKKYYKCIWKTPNNIKYEKLLEQRPYREEYYPKEIDGKILECLNKNENVLIVGKPLAGKSRTIYEVIKQLRKTFSITIIRIKDIKEEDFLIPIHLTERRRKKLVIIDNLHSFIEKDNFKLLLNKFNDEDSIILASSRTGFEFTQMKKMFIIEFGFFESFFNENIFQIEDVSVKNAKDFSQKIGFVWSDVFQN